ncbi:hypothetical protein FRC06_004276 [Ceratobasidium sp. 370]|nr:hypothetical protein FRC06_004276 [Ceratobasidium sp. 370]
MANITSKFGSRVQQHTTNLIKAIERIHEEESEAHIVRAENISRENDRLRKELYDLQQRIKILTDRLGFENLDRAEESLDECLVDAVRDHKAAAARIDTLTAELVSVRDQLALEQAARIEDQHQLEALGTDLARKKQLSLEARAESELNREALDRLKLELQAEWQKTSKLESMLSSVRKDNEVISSECEVLKAAAARDRAQRSSLAPETPLRPPTRLDADKADSAPRPEAGPTNAFVDNTTLPLEAQLAHLRTQYDELLASKTRLAEKYAREMAEFKKFKESVRLSSGGKGLVVTESGLRTRGQVSRRAKDSPTPAGRTANVPLPRISVPNDNIFIKEESPMSPGYMHPIRRLQREAGLATPDARSNHSPASDTDTQESQTTPSVEQPPNQGLPEPTTTVDEHSVRPTPPIKRSQSDDESSILLRRQPNATTPLARSHSSPAASSPHNRRKTSASSKSLGKRKAFVFDGEDDSSEEQPTSPKGDKTPRPALQSAQVEGSREERDARLRALRRKSGPQVLADYQQYKGRGRYAAGPPNPADKTINSEYEIDPTRNNGMAFEFDAVVRDKDERRKLIAGDCIACKEYYEAVGPMPKRAGAPLWRSPPPEGNQSSKPHTCKHHHAAAAEALANTVEKEDATTRKQAISRHRHNWAPASTPPDYWNIGFPNTQQVEDINRRADELHQEKRNAIEQEAG